MRCDSTHTAVHAKVSLQFRSMPEYVWLFPANNYCTKKRGPLPVHVMLRDNTNLWVGSKLWYVVSFCFVYFVFSDKFMSVRMPVTLVPTASNFRFGNKLMSLVLYAFLF